MQTLDCRIGSWQAQATFREVDGGKLLAVISATGRYGGQASFSRHTVVFDASQERDRRQQVQALMRHLLRDRYDLL